MEGEETGVLLLTYIPICAHMQVCHAWPFKAGLSRDGGHEHKPRVCFRPVLVAEHVANKVSEMRNAELRCLYSYCFPTEMGNVGNNSLLFPVFLRMCRLKEQEHQRWHLGFFLSGCSHAWSHLEFPRKVLIQGKPDCRYRLFRVIGKEILMKKGFPSDTQRGLVHNIIFNSAFVSFAGSVEALNGI